MSQVHTLTVVTDFGEYKKGQKIEGAEKVAEILASEQAVHVRKVFAPVKIEATIDTAITTKPALPKPEPEAETKAEPEPKSE